MNEVIMGVERLTMPLWVIELIDRSSAEACKVLVRYWMDESNWEMRKEYFGEEGTAEGI